MSKATGTAEWEAAMRALVVAIDLQDHLLRPIRDLINPGLGRVFFRFWQQHAGDDQPEIGVTSSEDSDCKWRMRAEAWYELHNLEVSHVIDWLIVSREMNQYWLRNVDDLGNPKKLTKCGTLDRLVVEATKGLRHRTTQPEIAIDRDEEVRIADLGDGYSLVQILTPNALRREGGRMHNCLRHGDHGTILGWSTTRYYSVRDPDDKPLGTLERHGAWVRQFAGPCNMAPTRDIIDRVAAVAEARGWLDLHAATSEFPDPEDDVPGVPVPVFENRRRF